jgi:hypothetical protein
MDDMDDDDGNAAADDDEDEEEAEGVGVCLGMILNSVRNVSLPDR